MNSKDQNHPVSLSVIVFPWWRGSYLREKSTPRKGVQRLEGCHEPRLFKQSLLYWLMLSFQRAVGYATQAVCAKKKESKKGKEKKGKNGRKKMRNWSELWSRVRSENISEAASGRGDPPPKKKKLKTMWTSQLKQAIRRWCCRRCCPQMHYISFGFPNAMIASDAKLQVTVFLLETSELTQQTLLAAFFGKVKWKKKKGTRKKWKEGNNRLKGEEKKETFPSCNWAKQASRKRRKTKKRPCKSQRCNLPTPYVIIVFYGNLPR